MLVITGTQRSGTSAIAECLIESGYDLGTTWFDEEALGGYEHPLICGFYQKYLGDPTFPFEGFEVPKIPKQQFHEINLQVVKWSYLLMNPAFVTIWHKFRPRGDTFLVMDRSKRKVLASKFRVWHRFRNDSVLLTQNSSKLQGNFESGLELLARLGYRHAVVRFPACLENLDQLNKQLAGLDPKVQITSDAWNKVVDKSKVHF